MRHQSKSIIGLICLIGILVISFDIRAETTKRGSLSGGVAHTAPNWFKESFLEIAEDAIEAAEADKHLMLFFQLNDCPYCDRMLHDSFEVEPLKSFIQAHFDVIAINIRGDREVYFDEDTSLSEKALSELLKVRATPAIMFLDADNKPITRVDGYRAPQRFRQTLEYVSARQYKTSSLAEYLNKKLDKTVYSLRENKQFSRTKDLSVINGPLAIIFEDGSCYDCAEFHDNLLANPKVKKELTAFTLMRLNTDADDSIVDFDGSTTTAAALASKHQMIYRPGVLVFDQGELVRRYDSLLFSHHFKEGLRYVSGGHYKNEDYRNYSQRRTEELLASGVDIDLSR